MLSQGVSASGSAHRPCYHRRHRWPTKVRSCSHIFLSLQRIYLLLVIFTPKKEKKREKKEEERICIARIQNLIMGCEERRGKEEKKRKDDEQLMKERANWQIAGDHQAHRGH